MLFQLGSVVKTIGVDSEVDNLTILQLINRHANGDWGNMPKEDKEQNKYNLEHGGRLFSSYDIGDKNVWIITEADRSVTTVLFPEEY